MGRAFLGALAGAVLGTVVWLGLESVTGRSMVWLVLLVGGLAGLGVRWLCQQRNSTTGTVATAMALLGIVGGNLVQPFLLDFIYSATLKPVPVIKIQDVDESDDEPEIEAPTNDESEVTADAESSKDAARDTEDEAPQAADAGPDQAGQSAGEDRSRPPASVARPSVPSGSAEVAEAIKQSAPYYVGRTRGFGQNWFELTMYVISSILAYLLGSGSKPPQPVPATDAGDATR